jgi:membrane protein
VGLFGINPAKIPFLWSLLFTLVPPLLMMLLFMIIYKVGPTGGVKWSSAFNGALFAAILWEIFRRGLGWYFSTIAVYNKLYGAFGAFVAITIWIFYSANVFLIGAEYAAICNERTDKRHLFAKTKSEK